MFNSELKRKVLDLEYSLQDCKEEIQETRKILSALFDHFNLCAKHEMPTHGKWVVEKKSPVTTSYYTQPESFYKPVEQNTKRKGK